MLTGVSPPVCTLCPTSQLFLSCPYHSTISHSCFESSSCCSLAQQRAACFPAPALFLSLGMYPLLKRFPLQWVFLWILRSAWSQCCDSATWAKAVSDVPAPKLCLFKHQDNWHVCPAQATGAVPWFPNSGFFILVVKEVPLTLSSSMEAAHWGLDWGGGRRARALQYVPVWSRHTYALVFQLFSAREY